MRGYISTKIANAVGKYFDGTYDGHVVVARDGGKFRTECFLHLSSGAIVRSVACLEDLYRSCDESVSLMENRLRRYKRKLKNHRWPSNEGARACSYRVLEMPSPSMEEDVPEDYTPVIVAEDAHTLKKLSLADAVMELDMSGEMCVVFSNARHGGVNVVYRRHDGAIGWIDPQT